MHPVCTEVERTYQMLAINFRACTDLQRNFANRSVRINHLKIQLHLAREINAASDRASHRSVALPVPTLRRIICRDSDLFRQLWLTSSARAEASTRPLTACVISWLSMARKWSFARFERAFSSSSRFCLLQLRRQRLRLFGAGFLLRACLNRIEHNTDASRFN